MADVDEARSFIDAQQERAEPGACLARLGPASDDKLLLLGDLDLAPVRCPLARLVEGIRVLRDQAFPPLLEGALVQRTAVATHHLADAQAGIAIALEEALDNRAALAERHVSQVAAALAQHVEDDVGGPD